MVVANYNLEAQRHGIILSNDVSILIAGDSHTALAINEVRLGSHFKNVSKEGECVFFTEKKLLAILDANPQIKEVWLAFSYQNILSNVENQFLHSSIAIARAQEYGPVLSWADLEVMRGLTIQDRVILYSRYGIGLPLGQGAQLPVSGMNSSLMGGYVFENDNIVNIDNLIKETQNHYKTIYREVASENFSQLFRAGYERIFQYCNENGISVVLVQTPLHLEYEMLIPDTIKSEYERWWQEFVEIYRIRFWDFSRFPLEENSFENLSHLNSEGAIHFSDFLKADQPSQLDSVFRYDLN